MENQMRKLNIGCGLDYREGFINIDGSDALPRVDKIINFSSESLLNYFKEGTIDFILANDFIEHHFHWEAVKILKDFFNLLKAGGILEMRLPDFEYISSSWQNSPENKIAFLFGGQDIPQGEKDTTSRKKFPQFFCHKYAYTQKSMRLELEAIGFIKIITKQSGTNFIVIAKKRENIMGNHRPNVSVVVKATLCHGCGVCSAVCLQDAIEMYVSAPGIFQPEIDTDKCNHCGLCLDVCSGKKHIGGKSLLGNVEKVWTGHSTNHEIRRNSASGGIVSGILVDLMEKGVIDGAVINVPDPEHPLYGKSILATSKKDIMHGAKSIYGMTEIGNGLRIAAQNPDIKKVAVVGLPCQMASVRNMLSKGGRLSKKVELLIGIMDGHNVYHAATEDALRMSGIDPDIVREVRYRSKGWSPYSYSIELLNKERKEFLWPKSSFQKIWDSFSLRPVPCLICNDFAAEHADIACADAWLDEYKGNQKGYSIVLAHTNAGKRVVGRLIKDKSLDLIEKDPSCIGRAQYCQLDYKKRTSYLRSIVLGVKEENIPPCLGKISLEDYYIEFANITHNMSSLSGRGESFNLDGASIRATQKKCIDKALSDVKCQNTELPSRKADVVFKSDILASERIKDETGISKKILFCGTGYGAGNIGDDAILSGLIRSTRTHLPEAEIGAISFSPDFTKNTIDIEKVWPFNNEGTIQAFQWATHVVLGGATLISENPNINYPLGHCAGLIKTAVALKKPICMLAVGTSDVVS